MSEVTEEACSKKHEKLQETMNSELTDIKVSIAGLPELLIEKLEKRFANKLTEKIVYGLCGLIILSVFTVIISQVVHAK